MPEQCWQAQSMFTEVPAECQAEAQAYSCEVQVAMGRSQDVGSWCVMKAGTGTQKKGISRR